MRSIETKVKLAAVFAQNNSMCLDVEFGKESNREEL